MRNMLIRDEREVAVDRAGDRIAYLVLSYGLLAVVAYRSFVDHQASWDLLTLVVLGGVVGAGYRVWRRVITRESLLLVGITVGIAIAVAALLALGVSP